LEIELIDSRTILVTRPGNERKKQQLTITRTTTMPTLDGVSRPSLDGIKQASSKAFSKAKLMVGLQAAEEDVESQQSERSASSFVEEAAELLCPELTFQQVI
jgi:hypothetical protein